MLCEGASQTVLGCWGTSLRSFELSTLVLGTNPASTKLSMPNGTCHRWAPTWYAGCLWHQPCRGCPETQNCGSLVDRQLWTLLFSWDVGWLFRKGSIQRKGQYAQWPAQQLRSCTQADQFFLTGNSWGTICGHDSPGLLHSANCSFETFSSVHVLNFTKCHQSTLAMSISGRTVKDSLLVVDYWLQSSARPSWVLLKSQFTMGPSNLESGKQFQSFTNVIRV